MVGYFMPIKNEYLRWQVGSMIGNQIGTTVNDHVIPSVNRYMMIFEKNRITIPEYHNNEASQIYTKIDDYMTKRSQEMDATKRHKAIPRRGNISIVRDALDADSVDDVHKGHRITLKHVKLSTASSDKKQQNRYYYGSSSNNAIQVSSKTAQVAEMEEYIKNICRHKNMKANVIKVYQVMSKFDVKNHDNKSTYCYWDDVDSHTNKTFDNVILDDSVYDKLKTDLEWFIDNEEWFNTKGVPYRRGYLLHGPPGTGKTSIIKAIANVYDFIVFNINLNVVPNDAALNKLIMDLNYYAQDNPYILCFEDIDRSALFSPTLYRSQNISMDTFLNVLDGIIESHGGITILTCNNDQILREYPALVRAGRIDLDIRIDFCTVDQVKRMMKHFYSEMCAEDPSLIEKIDNIEMTHPIAPASMSQLMINNKTNPSLVIDRVKAGNTNSLKQISKNRHMRMVDDDVDYMPPRSKKRKRKTLTDLRKELKSLDSSDNKAMKKQESNSKKRIKLEERIKKMEEKK